MHSRIIIWNILAVKKKQAWALGHGRLVLIQTHSAESRLAGMSGSEHHLPLDVYRGAVLQRVRMERYS